MRKLVTIPYGSRLYGTFDENSDWDWKVLYLPELRDLLVGKSMKNKFFSTSLGAIKNTSDDTDTELICLQTFSRDVLEGQTYALEVAFGILESNFIPGLEFHEDPAVIRQYMQTLVDRFLTSNINSMVGYAYNQAQVYSDKGVRLEKLHTFKKFVETVLTDGGLYSNLELRLENAISAGQAQEGLVDGQLLYVKPADPEQGNHFVSFVCLEKMYPGDITIAETLRRVEVQIKKYGKRANQAMINEGKDWKAISHALRVTLEALWVLNKGNIPIPFPWEVITILKDIKYGRVEWELVQKQLIANIDQITLDQKTSALKPKTPELEEEFLVFLEDQMMEMYNLTVKENK